MPATSDLSFEVDVEEIFYDHITGVVTPSNNDPYICSIQLAESLSWYDSDEAYMASLAAQLPAKAPAKAAAASAHRKAPIKRTKLSTEGMMRKPALEKATKQTEPAKANKVASGKRFMVGR